MKCVSHSLRCTGNGRNRISKHGKRLRGLLRGLRSIRIDRGRRSRHNRLSKLREGRREVVQREKLELELDDHSDLPTFLPFSTLYFLPSALFSFFPLSSSFFLLVASCFHRLFFLFVIVLIHLVSFVSVLREYVHHG